MGFGGGGIPTPPSPGVGGGAALGSVQVPGYAGSGLDQLDKAFDTLQRGVQQFQVNKQNRIEADYKDKVFAEEKQRADRLFEAQQSELGYQHSRDDIADLRYEEQDKRAKQEFDLKIEKAQRDNEIEKSRETARKNFMNNIKENDAILQKAAIHGTDGFTPSEKEVYDRARKDLILTDPEAYYKNSMETLKNTSGEAAQVNIVNSKVGTASIDFIEQLNSANTLQELQALKNSPTMKGITKGINEAYKTGHVSLTVINQQHILYGEMIRKKELEIAALDKTIAEGKKEASLSRTYDNAVQNSNGGYYDNSGKVEPGVTPKTDEKGNILYSDVSVKYNTNKGTITYKGTRGNIITEDADKSPYFDPNTGILYGDKEHTKVVARPQTKGVSDVTRQVDPKTGKITTVGKQGKSGGSSSTSSIDDINVNN
jgi:hypothetical protein